LVSDDRLTVESAHPRMVGDLPGTKKRSTFTAERSECAAAGGRHSDDGCFGIFLFLTKK